MTDLPTRFAATRLGDMPMPVDLSALLRAIDTDPAFETGPRDPLAIVGATLLLPGRGASMLDHDYLTAADLADPDIAANVAAMRETARHIGFAASFDDGALFGYWRWADAAPAPVILDTEGQYAIAEGDTLAETLRNRLVLDEMPDQAAILADVFRDLGIDTPSLDEDTIYARMDRREAAMVLTPQAHRAARYEALRAVQ